MNDRKPMQLRLPPDLKAWIEAEAAKNGASQNSEVIRAIRDRMERVVIIADSFPDRSPEDTPPPAMRD
ncbi:hypothetical protein HUK65_06325 [Rhodobacteraceae bacterium 2376]|uniref:Arc-like DNA binding dprotein n=1 Tax=Rhabdonatronobacter sediminivivens TaxID=2743469 RepID=A0A7Z0HYF1_9RHOB|nr:CopG family transcriptional regulator [Rhabdonatronobacter sediminivivens]NYS24603.1 hypothetical protein [Rhabdonatronobacter sediminivivens]